MSKEPIFTTTWIEIVAENYKSIQNCQVSILKDSIKCYQNILRTYLKLKVLENNEHGDTSRYYFNYQLPREEMDCLNPYELVSTEYILYDLEQIESFKNFLNNNNDSDGSNYLYLTGLKKINTESQWNLTIYKENIKNYSLEKELILEIILDNNDKFFISDKESISKFLSEMLVQPKDIIALKNEIKQLGSCINDLENAIKFAPLSTEYQKTKDHFENLKEDITNNKEII